MPCGRKLRKVSKKGGNPRCEDEDTALDELSTFATLLLGDATEGK